LLTGKRDLAAWSPQPPLSQFHPACDGFVTV
jgi:hypothetical protein